LNNQTDCPRHRLSKQEENTHEAYDNRTTIVFTLPSTFACQRPNELGKSSRAAL
jgi:hypothetical protein